MNINKYIKQYYNQIDYKISVDPTQKLKFSMQLSNDEIKFYQFITHCSNYLKKIINHEFDFFILNLRNDSEFVMHKILDCLGDLALSKHPLLGKIVCSQGGHKLTNDFLRNFFMDKSNYSVIEFKENKPPNSLLYTKSLAASA